MCISFLVDTLLDGLSNVVCLTNNGIAIGWAPSVLGVTRYICNALCNIITFVVTK